MNEYKLSIKILLFGFPPLKENYEVDGFLLKNGILSQQEVSDEIENKLFTTLPYITFCTYSVENDDNRYYNYFETKSDIVINIPKKIKEKSEVAEYILKNKDIIKNIELLERKLRLQFNIRILFPIVRIDISTEKIKNFSFCIRYNNFPNQFTSQFFDEKTFEHNSHLKLDIKNFISLENKNIKFKRAIDYYFSSFDNSEISIRFILLFSALESLLLTSKNNLCDNLAVRASRILKYIDSFNEQDVYDEIKKLYNIRSKYIHGSNKNVITLDDEKKLRDYVRAILLIYWRYVEQNKLGSNQVIKNLKQSVEFDFQTKMFAKYLKVTDFKIAYKELYYDFINEIKKGNYKIKEIKNDEIIVSD